MRWFAASIGALTLAASAPAEAHTLTKRQAIERGTAAAERYVERLARDRFGERGSGLTGGVGDYDGCSRLSRHAVSCYLDFAIWEQGDGAYEECGVLVVVRYRTKRSRRTSTRFEGLNCAEPISKPD